MSKFRLSCVAAAATVFAALPVSAEVTGSGPNGFVSRHEAVVEASPRDVWLALISPAGWWASEHTWSGDSANLTITPQAGGCFCEKIPEVDEPGRFTLEGSVEHMRVIQAYPEVALRMQGALGPLQSEPVTGILTIAISKVDAGTRIVWEYNVGGAMRYEVPVIARAVDGVMGVQLAGLAKGLGLVTPPPPLPSDPDSDPAPESDPASESAVAPGSAAAPEDRVAPATADDEAPRQIKGATGEGANLPSVDDVFADLEEKPDN